MVTGILIDTVSIQSYIFSSNKLKENLGASWLVQNIFKDLLKQAVKETFQTDFDLNAWRENSEGIFLDFSAFEVGYIGGGNALLFTQNHEAAIELIKNWSRILLLHAPGLRTAVAVEDFDLNNFQQSQNKLFEALQNNKQRFIPQTQLNNFGITSQCKRTGLSAEVWYQGPEKGEYISTVADLRIKARIQPEYMLGISDRELLGPNWIWTDDLSELGQHEGKDSHIAIVHIDGNSMGERFRQLRSLTEIRRLADSVEIATRTAFCNMVTDLRVRLEQEQAKTENPEAKKEVLDICLTQKDQRYVIPVRPIILGGDDVTFVCDGRLGIYLAQLYMQHFAGQTVSDAQSLSACAGVAVIRSKYPFFRGYELAEELCQNAKQVRKASRSNDSWLDFQLVHAATTDALAEVRAQQYHVSEGTLLTRPYHLMDSTKMTSLPLALKQAAKLQKWPSGKRKELRQVLSQDKSSRSDFVSALKYRGEYFLPEYTGLNLADNALFSGKQTPYFDLIELAELYPSVLLKELK